MANAVSKFIGGLLIVLGLALGVTSVVGGIWITFYWCFWLGLVGTIEGFQHSAPAVDIALNVARMVFGTTIGGAFSWLCCMLAGVVLTAGAAFIESTKSQSSRY